MIRMETRLPLTGVFCVSLAIGNLFGAPVKKNPSEKHWFEGVGLYGTVYATERETVDHIKMCREHGVGLLLPSLSGGGTVLWKTDKADYYPAHREAFEAGFDGLAGLIKHAHEAGIKVYPSVAVCPGGRMLSEHPEWETHDRLGRPSSETAGAAMAMSYPEARRTKIDLLMDLVAGYEIDGVLLDYCRYPENSKKPEYGYGFYGYDKPLIEACKSLHGFDPREVAIDSPQWTIFNTMRAQTITTFVREFRDAVKRSGSTIRIGGFGDTEPEMEARSCGRDYASWAKEGLIDDFFLATYVEPIPLMRTTVWRARQAIGPNTVLLSALTPFNSFLKSDEEMVRAAKAQLDGGAEGLWIYREDYLSQLNLWDGAAQAAALAREKMAGP